MSPTAIDDIATIVRQAEDAAYERGKADAKREMLKYLTTDALSVEEETRQTARSPATAESRRPASKRKRAPRGVVGKLIRRVLSSRPGLSPTEILRHAENDSEKMIQIASVRNELRRGREDGKYRSEDGHWYLPSTQNDEAEGTPWRDAPSAPLRNQGERYAPALAEWPARPEPAGCGEGRAPAGVAELIDATV